MELCTVEDNYLFSEDDTVLNTNHILNLILYKRMMEEVFVYFNTIYTDVLTIIITIQSSNICSKTQYFKLSCPWVNDSL